MMTNKLEKINWKIGHLAIVPKKKGNGIFVVDEDIQEKLVFRNLKTGSLRKISSARIIPLHIQDGDILQNIVEPEKRFKLGALIYNKGDYTYTAKGEFLIEDKFGVHLKRGSILRFDPNNYITNTED